MPPAAAEPLADVAVRAVPRAEAREPQSIEIEIPTRIAVRLHGDAALAHPEGRVAIAKNPDGSGQQEKPLTEGRRSGDTLEFEFRVEEPGKYDVTYTAGGTYAQKMYCFDPGMAPPRFFATLIATEVEVPAGGRTTVDAYRLRISLRDYDNAVAPLRGCAVFLRKQGGDWQGFLTDREGRLCPTIDAPGLGGFIGVATGEGPMWLALAAGNYDVFYANYYYASPFDDEVVTLSHLKTYSIALAAGAREITLDLPGFGDEEARAIRRACRRVQDPYLASLGNFCNYNNARDVKTERRDLTFPFCNKASAKLRAIFDLTSAFPSVTQLVAGVGTDPFTGKTDSKHSYLKIGNVYVDPTIAQLYYRHGGDSDADKRALLEKLPPSVLRHGLVANAQDLADFHGHFRWHPLHADDYGDRTRKLESELYEGGRPAADVQTKLAQDAVAYHGDHLTYARSRSPEGTNAWRAIESRTEGGEREQALQRLRTCFSREMDHVARLAGAGAGANP